MLFLKICSSSLLILKTFLFEFLGHQDFFDWIIKVLIFVSSRKKRLLLLLSSFVSEVGSVCFLRKLLCLGSYSLMDVWHLVAVRLLQLFNYHLITFKSLIEHNTWFKITPCDLKKREKLITARKITPKGAGKNDAALKKRTSIKNIKRCCLFQAHQKKSLRV